MGIEPTQDLLGPTLVLKTRGTTRHQSPPQSVLLQVSPDYTKRMKRTKVISATLFRHKSLGRLETMRSIRADILASVCMALILPGIARAQTGDTEGPQTIRLKPFHGPNVTRLTQYGNCQWLYPLDEPKERLTSEPNYRSAKRVYYAARYGDAQDNVYTLVLDESGGTGSGFNTLYADLNNDNRLDSNGERFSLVLSGLTISEAKNVRITLSVSAGGETIPYSFEFTAFLYKDRTNPVEKIHATCRDSTIMTGEAMFGGKRCKVALADLNSNGLFNDYEQGLFKGDRFFVDLSGEGTFQGESGNTESFPYAEYARVGGDWYTIEASRDGGTVRIRSSHPTFGAIKAAGPVRSVGLSSPRQFQSLEPKDGRVEAIVGSYQVRDVTLERIDGDKQRWSTVGRYKQAGPKIVIEPNQTTMLPDFLPLTVAVDVLSTFEPNTIELQPRIADAWGGTYSTLRRNDSRHEPPAHLAVKDADGKVVAEAKLEYG